MGNIVIAIAKGNVEDKLRPDFHKPKQITINNEPHTLYMRKGRIPEAVEEVYSRDIDAYGIKDMPAPYDYHIRAYINRNRVSH